MDFFLGSITGFVCGFGLLYIQYHKSVISYAISSVKDELHSLHQKVDKLVQNS
jgi:hypothetical protein